MNVILHVFGYLIVKNMFLGDNAGPFELGQESIVCPYHLGILYRRALFEVISIANL
jgi:hypothetical protein